MRIRRCRSSICGAHRFASKDGKTVTGPEQKADLGPRRNADEFSVGNHADKFIAVLLKVTVNVLELLRWRPPIHDGPPGKADQYSGSDGGLVDRSLFHICVS